MTEVSIPKYRDHTPFWREGEALQNFGDFLTPYFLDRLFLPVPRLPGAVRLVGSYLSDHLVGQAVDSLEGNTLAVRAPLIGWAGGLRDKDSLSPEALKHVEILSLRGPLSAEALGRSGQIPLGDPGLLLPALYSPTLQADFSGRTLCIPHFNDLRSDEELCTATGADLVLRPAIAADLAAVESFLDQLTSADFVLCGSLHAAIAAAAYGTAFAFWDSGEVDIPFKWQDFAASIHIDCAFSPTVATGKAFYDSSIRKQKKLPSMWPALAVAPYPIRPEALLRLLSHELAQQRTKAPSYLDELQQIFAQARLHQDNLIADANRLVQSLGDEIEMLQARLVSEQAESAELRVRSEESARLSNQAVTAFQRAMQELAASGDRQAEQLRRAYARPWRPVKRLLQRSVLRFVLLFEGKVSKRRVGKIQRSLAKRSPEHFPTEWSQAKSRARGEVPEPMRPAQSSPSLQPHGPDFVYRALLALAVVSEPISKRRADRFRRSAKKRDPHRFRAYAAQNTLMASNAFGGPVADPDRARRILVTDYRLPRPDVSAGEKATFGLISDLCDLGLEVTFVATDNSDASPYRENIEALGVEVILRSAQYASAGDYVRAEGARFGAFYFIRVDVAEALLPSARAVAPDARIIFHAPDLYFLREGRAAKLSGDPKDFASAAETEQREGAIMRAVDHVVLVSPAELPMVSQIVPLNKISVFPALYSEVARNPVGFAPRQHMFFLGGFGHTPNVDAVLWFVEAIWPAIHAALPEVEFHIIGAEAPAQIRELGKCPGVRVIGFVADLNAVLTQYRISVAPLRYGAGIKGKLGAALGAGVPSVSTSIGAEGMGIHDGLHALVRDEAAAFAQAATALYSDEALWSRIAANGQKLVEDNFGNAANQSAFFRVLEKAGALALDPYVAHCKALTPSALPDPDPAQAVDISIIIPVHNQWALTAACLNSVQIAVRASGLICEVILADDGSTDGTREAAALHPGLRVLHQAVNLGFLRNCNAAASVARGKTLLFLNNDTVVMPNWLTALWTTLDENPKAAIVGSKLIYPDGVIQEAGGALYSDGTAANLGRGQHLADPQYADDREVDYISGASILVRREFWEEIGGFDERFAPAYCEDSDLAMAARSLGRTVVFSAQSVVVHFEHGSYGEQSVGPKQQQLVNNVKLLEKWKLQLQSHNPPP